MSRPLEAYEQAAADFARLRDLCTPGPWRADNPDDSCSMNMYCVTRAGAPEPWDESDLKDVIAVTLLQAGGTRIGHGNDRWDRDADFIAAARSSELPEMVRELVARLTAAEEACRELLPLIHPWRDYGFDPETYTTKVRPAIEKMLAATSKGTTDANAD